MATKRVAGIQMSVSEKMEENLEKILDHIQKCDADFIVFPAMSLTGYTGNFSDNAIRDAWRLIKAACRQSYTNALVGTGSKEFGDTVIQTRIATHEGSRLGSHEMLVPTKSDREFCRPGEELKTFEFEDLIFGCLIGNDLWVVPGGGPYPDPRLSYQLGQKGVQIIFHGNRSGKDPECAAYYEANLLMRARESEVYIVTVNTVPDSGALNCPSGVVSPHGEWLFKCPLEGEQTFSYDIELETT